MKKLILIFQLLVFLNSAKADTIFTDLLNFAELTSKFNNIAIVTDDSIEASSYYFIYQEEVDITIAMFKKMLESKGLYLYRKDNFYYVTDKKLPEFDLRQIELKNYIIDDIQSLLAQFDINATYSRSSNSIFFRSDDFIYDQIKFAIKDMDKTLEQVEFKLTITETNLKDIKDKGTDLISLLKPLNHADLAYYINLITHPFISNSNIIRNNDSSYFGILNFLESNGVTKIISSPFLTAKNHKEAYFSTVSNIPYLISKTETTSQTHQKSDSYEYRDVGLKIKIKPVILKDHVDFDLHLVLEDILSGNTLTPITSKKELKSSYSLKRGDVLVLSGINKTTTQKKRNGVPILKDIFLLKWLFSVEHDEDVDTVLTLSIQVI